MGVERQGGGHSEADHGGWGGVGWRGNRPGSLADKHIQCLTTTGCLAGLMCPKVCGRLVFLTTASGGCGLRYRALLHRDRGLVADRAS